MSIYEGWMQAANALEEPYPEDVFTPMTTAEVLDVVKAMNEAVPHASERMHASWARHWARSLRDIAAEQVRR